MKVNLSDFKKIFTNGTELKQLFLNGVQVWKSGYKNWVQFSINADGSIYNGTGYKEGYRLSSSGAEKAQSGSVLTGFIPARRDDVIRMAGATWGTTVSGGYCYIQYYDAEFNLIYTVNRYMMETSNGVSNSGDGVNKSASSILTDGDGITMFNIVFTTNSEYDYIRINAAGTGSDMIVTVNEEIE